MSVRSLPAFEDGFDVQTAGGLVIGSVVLAGYAAWITADLVSRWLTVLVVAAAVGHVLARKYTLREQLVYTGYGLALLLVLTPITLVVPDVLSADAYGVSPWGMAFTTGNAIVFAFFAVLAGLVAYATYRLGGGQGVVDAIRDRRAR